MIFINGYCCYNIFSIIFDFDIIEIYEKKYAQRQFWQQYKNVLYIAIGMLKYFQ